MSRAPSPLLEEGANFTVYVAARGDKAAHAQPFYIFYSPLDRFGSIFLAVEKDKSKKLNQTCLPVHEITEIVVGKRTTTLSSEVASDAKEAACFALVSLENTLEIEAESEDVAKAWIEELNRLRDLPENQKVSAMYRGSNIVRHFENKDTAEVFAFYRANERKGVVYICERGKRETSIDKERALHLNQVTDVWPEKKSPYWKREAVAAIDADLCFSFKTVLNSLHAQCESKEERDAWLDALKISLASTRKTGAVSPTGSGLLSPTGGAMAPILGRMPSVTATSSSVALPQNAPTILDAIAETSDEKKQAGEEQEKKAAEEQQQKAAADAETQQKAAEDKPAAAAEAEKEPEPEADPAPKKAAPAADKQAQAEMPPEAQKQEEEQQPEPAAAPAPAEPTPEPAAPAPVPAAAEPVAETVAEQAESKAAEAPAVESKEEVKAEEPQPAPVEEPPKDPIATITAGGTFKIYSEGASGEVTTQEVFLFYEPNPEAVSVGAFYWCSPGERTLSEERRLPFNKINDVYLGIKHPIFQKPGAEGADPAVTFSVASKSLGVALHVSTDAQKTRDLWLAAIRAVFDSAKKNRKAVATASPARVVTPSLSVAAPAPKPEEPIWGLFKGQEFIVYTENKEDPAHATRTAMNVWYDAPALGEPAGKLYCSPIGTRDKTGPSFNMMTLSDVYMGKHQPVFKTPAIELVSPKTCVSLVSATEKRTLDLQALSEEERKRWLQGLRAVIDAKYGLDIAVAVRGLNVDKAPVARLVAVDEARVLSETEEGEKVNPTFSKHLLFPGGAQHPDFRLRIAISSADGDLAMGSYDTTYRQLFDALGKGEHSLPVTGAANVFLVVTVTRAAKPVPVAPVVADPAEVAFIKRGVEFTRYTGANGQPERVLVFYELDQSRLGSLYWVPAGQARVVSADACLPLGKLTDVYSDALHLEPAPEAKDADVVMSLMAGDVQLHLEAASKEDHDTFLKGVFAVLGSTPKVALEATNDLARLGAAQAFRLYGAEGDTTEVVVSYEPHEAPGALGCLFWNNAGEARDVDPFRTLWLEHITGLVAGAETRGLKAGSADPYRSFALHTRSGAVVELEAPSQPERDSWLAALVRVLRGRPAQAHSRQDQAPRKPLLSPLSAPVDILRAGTQFTLYSVDAAITAAQKRQVTVFFVPDPEGLGTLYWNEGTSTEPDAQRSLPLARVSDVFLGKQRDVFHYPAARDADVDCCFTIRSKRVELNLEAATPRERELWLNALRSVLQTRGKRIVDEGTTDGDSIHQLIRGGRFEFYFKAPNGKVASREIWVQYDPAEGRLGTLYFSEVEKRTAKPNRGIPLHLISDVFVGKQAAPLRAIPAPAERCFSIIAQNDSLHLAAPTQELRDSFLKGLRDALARNGKMVVEDRVTPQDGDVVPYDEIDMRRGRIFHTYIQTPVGMQRREVFVFYDADDEHNLGRLFWSEPGRRDRLYERSLPLDKLTDIYLGTRKITEDLDSKRSAPGTPLPKETRAFTLVTSEGLVHLEAANPRERDSWLFGLTLLVRAYGQRVLQLLKSVSIRGLEIVVSARNLRSRGAVAVLTTETGQHISHVERRTGDSDPEWSRRLFLPSSLFTGPAQKLRIAVFDFTNARTRVASLPIEELIGSVTFTVTDLIKTLGQRSGFLLRNAFSKDKDAALQQEGSSLFVQPELPSVPARTRQQMMEGQHFRAYFADDLGRVFANDVVVAFRPYISEPGDDGVGSIYWYPEGGAPLTSHRIPLDRITDLFLGKQAAIFQQPGTAYAEPAACASIASADAELHLEAETPEDREAWCLGMQHLLMAHGKRLLNDAVAPAGINTAVVPAPAPHLVPRVGTRRTVSHFRRYQVDQKGVASTSTVEVVFDEADEDKVLTFVTTNGILGDNGKIALKDITDFYLGKLHPTFVRIGEDVQESNACLSLIGKGGFELHLEAPNAQARAQWVDRFAAWSGSDQPEPLTAAKMAEGHRFKQFVRKADGTGATVTDVLVAVRKKGDESAIIVWPVDGIEAKESQRLEFRTITDILEGKQAAVFFAPEATSAEPAACVSIIGTRDELHLEAPSRIFYLKWRRALHTLLTSAGLSSTSSEAQPQLVRDLAEFEAHGDRQKDGLVPIEVHSQVQDFYPPTALPPTLAALYKRADYIQAPMAPVLKALSAGARFTGYAPNGKIALRVWYNEKRAAFLLAPIGVERPSGGFALADVTAVTLGKQSVVLSRSSHAKDAAAERCFTITTKTGQINLEAASAEAAIAWLDALSRLLVGVAGKDIVAESAVKFAVQPSPEWGLAGKRSDRIGQSDALVAEQLASDAFAAGWRIFNQGETGVTGEKARVVYSTDKPAVLTVVLEEAKREAAEITLDLQAVTNVLIGKKTEVLRASDAASERTVVLATPSAIVNLEAPSADVFACWLLGLSAVLSRFGKAFVANADQDRFTIVPVPKPLDRGHRRVIKHADVLSGKLRFTVPLKGELVPAGAWWEILARGTDCILHQADGTHPVSVHVAVARSGAVNFCWSPQALGKQRLELVESSVPLMSVRSLAVGQPGFFSAESVDRSTLFVIGFAGFQLQLEARSNADRDMFVSALLAVLLSAGVSVSQEDPLSNLLDDLARIIPPPSMPQKEAKTMVALPVGPQAEYSSTGLLSRVLAAGQVFKGYAKKGKKAVVRVSTFFLRSVTENGDSKLGALYWVNAGEPMLPSVDRRLPIEDIKEITLGPSQTHKDLAADAVAEQCLSIVGAEQTLDLEGFSVEAVVAWKVALEALRAAAARN